MNDKRTLDDLMDSLVADYSDQVAQGLMPPKEDYLNQVPREHREALGRCLSMIESGMARAPSGDLALQPGMEFDGFRIECVLGRGGMSIVYLAEDVRLRREVALKVLRPGLAVERRNVDRFRREAMAVAKVRHPHILEIYSVGAASGHHYIAMEYVCGPNLAEVFDRLPRHRELTARDLADAASAPGLAAGRESYEEALVALMSSVARAVAVAHELGIVHRDLKPSNILVHGDGRPVVTDFGLAKEEGDMALSLTGEVLGTPYYMSPEQVVTERSRVDGRTDIYSMGVTLYEGLTGRRPFEGETVYAVFEAIRNLTPPSVRALAPWCSRNAQEVVRKAMQKTPGARYRNAMDLAVDLEALAAGQSTQALLEQGGPVRRFFNTLRRAFSGARFEYKSPRTFLGVPLVHINLGPGEGRRRRVAKGWIAVGPVAIGGCCFGSVSLGGLALGGCSVGLVGLGGLAVGGVALGGCALGTLFGAGGFATGLVAFGGCAVGYYAMGGNAFGQYVYCARRQDPEAIEWFSTYMSWLGDFIHWFPHG